MAIDELIARLSDENPRPARLAPAATVTLAAFLALIVVLVESAVWLKLRVDFAAGLAIYNHIFALKLIFTGSIVAAALPIVRDLSIPGRRLGKGSIFIALPFATITVLALWELTRLPVREWAHHVGAASWLECLWEIPALSIPAFIILALAVRRLAPTRLVRAGAFIGLLAGGIGAVGYALHCHDDAIAFVALSYTVAILEVALLGALLGRLILRWR